MKKIDIIKADDWTGLYLDGVLVHENHRLTAIELLDYLGIDYGYRWLANIGEFLPKNLEDVPEGYPE